MIIFPLILMLLSLFIIPAYGESHVEVFVTTDKLEYVESDSIIITGSVSEILDGDALIIKIMYGGGYVDIEQVSIELDGFFTETVVAEGELWERTGEYLVIVSYGDYYMAAETTFYYDVTYIEPQFPLILEEIHINKVTKEMDRWKDILNQTDIEISQTMTDLDEAILENATEQIALRSEHIGSLLALTKIFETLIITLHQQMEIYS